MKNTQTATIIFPFEKYATTTDNKQFKEGLYYGLFPVPTNQSPVIFPFEYVPCNYWGDMTKNDIVLYYKELYLVSTPVKEDTTYTIKDISDMDNDELAGYYEKVAIGIDKFNHEKAIINDNWQLSPKTYHKDTVQLQDGIVIVDGIPMTYDNYVFSRIDIMMKMCLASMIKYRKQRNRLSEGLLNLYTFLKSDSCYDDAIQEVSIALLKGGYSMVNTFDEDNKPFEILPHIWIVKTTFNAMIGAIDRALFLKRGTRSTKLNGVLSIENLMDVGYLVSDENGMHYEQIESYNMEELLFTGNSADIFKMLYTILDDKQKTSMCSLIDYLASGKKLSALPSKQYKRAEYIISVMRKGLKFARLASKKETQENIMKECAITRKTFEKWFNRFHAIPYVETYEFTI